MRIPLTHKQVQMLAPYFDQVRSTRHTGRPGMLVAHFGSWHGAVTEDAP